MFVRNCLSTGDYVVPVPLGLPLTLQYNEDGKLQKVYKGYEESSRENISSQILKDFLHSTTLPITIPLQGGTTWVRGVLYTHTEYSNNGNLPEAITDNIILDYRYDPTKFAFFAGNIESLAMKFGGAATVNKWLVMAGFSTLSGWVIPAGLTKEAFAKLIHNERFPFRFPLIMSYIIYNLKGVSYVSTELKQYTVSRVVRYNDQNGNIKATLYNKADSNTLSVNISDVIKYNVLPNTRIVLDKYNNMIYSAPTDNKVRDKRTSTIVCSVCGKQFNANMDGEVTCPDVHCMSRMYPEFVHFLSALNMPVLGYAQYDSLVKAKKLLFISDLFELDEYKDYKLEITLANLLGSVVPISVLPDQSIIAIFANKCNNNISAFRYYISHPDKINHDLGISGHNANKLINWLTDTYNYNTLDALLDCKQISISNTNKKFEGAPIFRGKHIMITGTFTHGDKSDIILILNSYCAEVVSNLTPHVDCVVVGDMLENVDGKALNIARASNIPIYQERDFFKAYGIDEDLAENL